MSLNKYTESTPATSGSAWLYMQYLTGNAWFSEVNPSTSSSPSPSRYPSLALSPSLPLAFLKGGPDPGRCVPLKSKADAFRVQSLELLLFSGDLRARVRYRNLSRNS